MYRHDGARKINFGHVSLVLSFEASVHFRREYGVMTRPATALTLSNTIDCPSSSDIILITYLVASNPQSTNAF